MPHPHIWVHYFLRHDPETGKVVAEIETPAGHQPPVRRSFDDSEKVDLAEHAEIRIQHEDGDRLMKALVFGHNPHHRKGDPIGELSRPAEGHGKNKISVQWGKVRHFDLMKADWHEDGSLTLIPLPNGDPVEFKFFFGVEFETGDPWDPDMHQKKRG